MPQSREYREDMACRRWEALLVDAVDGELRSGDESEFAAHMAACPQCAGVFEAARRGRQWLGFFDAEPEMPAGLEQKILARTGPGPEALVPVGATAGGIAMPVLPEPWQQAGLRGWAQRHFEPRLMLTAAMAFFSIALTLNMTTHRLATLRPGTLRPAAMRAYIERQLAMASVPVIRYYDHLRLVTELQSAVRQMERTPKGSGAGGSGQPGNSAQPSGTGVNRQNRDRMLQADPALTTASAVGNDPQSIFETSLQPVPWPVQPDSDARMEVERSAAWTA